MPSFEVNPGWYETFWYSERPNPKCRSFSHGLVGLAAIVVLLASSGVVLTYIHS